MNVSTTLSITAFLFALSVSGTLAQDARGTEVVSDKSVMAEQKSKSSFANRIKRYHIVNGDVLELSFEFSPEFNQVVTVQPDGYITLRDIGDVRVAGQTVPELTSSLQAAYSKILYQPTISIALKDFERPYFVAGGQLARPGKYDLRGATTLVQAITMAGGFTEKSKHSQVLLFRRVSDQWTEARVFDLKKMLHQQNLAEDPYLEPGDMLFVPQNTISKIARYIPHTSVGTYVNPF
jgi:polysaccharide export outer membrane protein